MTQYHPDQLVQMRNRAAALAVAAQLLADGRTTTTPEILTLSMVLESYITDGYETTIRLYAMMQPPDEETAATAG
jgi:hypothetical protein